MRIQRGLFKETPQITWTAVADSKFGLDSQLCPRNEAGCQQSLPRFYMIVKRAGQNSGTPSTNLLLECDFSLAPAGLVHFAVARDSQAKTRKFNFSIRHATRQWYDLAKTPAAPPFPTIPGRPRRTSGRNTVSMPSLQNTRSATHFPPRLELADFRPVCSHQPSFYFPLSANLLNL